MEQDVFTHSFDDVIDAIINATSPLDIEFSMSSPAAAESEVNIEFDVSSPAAAESEAVDKAEDYTPTYGSGTSVTITA